MLVTDSARGMDGTGIFKVSREGKRDWMKIQGHPFRLFEAKLFPKFWKSIASPEWTRFLVGHNRAASKGTIDTDSAHPFEFEHIVLVHNGTVTGACDIPELKKFTVDSEAICASIAKRGIQKTIDMNIGPFALVWYNSKEKTLNMLRNNGRPLYVMEESSSSRFIFGSEPGILEWAGKRKYLYGIPKLIPEMKLLTWHIDKFEPVVSDIQEPKYNYKGWSSSDDLDMWGGVSTSCATPYTPPVHTVVPFAAKTYPKSDQIAAENAAANKEEANKTGTTATTAFPPIRHRPKINQIIEVYGYKKGDAITFQMVDFKWQDDKHSRAYIQAAIEAHNNVEVEGTFYGNGADLDVLDKADWQEGTVASIVELLDKTREDGAPTYRIYVTQIIGMSVEDIDLTAELSVDTSGEVPTLDPEPTESPASLVADSGIIVVSGSKLIN